MASQRATCWSLTINNPTPADEENIAQARQQGWKVHGQKEKGAQGTEHYQLMLQTPQVRPSAVKKVFPRAHIEIARDRIALEKYVNKEDTRIASLEVDQEKYPSLQKLWDMFAQWITDNRKTHEDVDLKMFDNFIRDSIDEGFIVEPLAVNPQVRSSIKLYGGNIIFRSLRRQTDRQTDENNVEVEE